MFLVKAHHFCDIKPRSGEKVHSFSFMSPLIDLSDCMAQEAGLTFCRTLSCSEPHQSWQRFASLGRLVGEALPSISHQNLNRFTRHCMRFSNLFFSFGDVPSCLRPLKTSLMGSFLNLHRVYLPFSVLPFLAHLVLLT